jgi:hypothetical protein
MAVDRAGNPSAYTGPFLGTNYLWDRTQQQVLGLLDRFDYAGAEELLKPYFKTKKLGAVPNLLKAGIAWNRGEFDSFFKFARATNVLDRIQSQSQTWWWMAYEQAYLATIRLKQNNTAEAMLHSFRSVEGCLYEWTISTCPDDIEVIPHRYPNVRNSILQRYPSISCLNILTGQSFKELNQASLFAKVHDRVRQSIEQT